MILNTEVFAFDEEMPGGRGKIPELHGWSIRDNGARVGAYRIMDVPRSTTSGAIVTSAHFPRLYHPRGTSHELSHPNFGVRSARAWTAEAGTPGLQSGAGS